MVKINVKWGKQAYPDIEIDKNDSVQTMKAVLMSLTNVPIERQKLMAKGIWKGILKDDVSLSSLDKFVDGAQIMLMGSADTVKKPEKATVFVEDMTQAEVAETGTEYPAGLTNLGNTCYMNSTLQCLRAVPEFRQALRALPSSAPNSADPASAVSASLRDAYAQMDNSVEGYTPMALVDTLRRVYPQFAQQGPRGGYMQQDSEEFLSTLLLTLSQKLTTPHGLPSLGSSSNMVDALFALDMQETLSCTESDAEPVTTKKIKQLKLVCNITKDTNHVSEGIKLGLEGTVEKNSDVLGRNAVWQKAMRINSLPKYICVQFMRFYWKLTPDSRDHTGVKCKMLRPISFPMVLDTYEFCSDELKSILKVSRDKHAEKLLNEFKDDKKKEGDEDKMEIDEEAKTPSVVPDRAPGLGLPADFKGNYEIFGVVTHKGRSADSGHYIGWTRDKGDEWFCFDDDDVSACKSEDVLKLKGGGDWHMTYLAFYRARD